jgi:hypothetical protein
MGIEPTNVGATIRCVNHFATTAIMIRKLAEGAGFEPAWACTLTVFKTAPL